MSDDRVEEVKKNILSPSQWVRILYMVFYAIACWVLLFVLPVIIACQVIIALISGNDNRDLRDFGAKLSAYFHSALDYLLYVNDDKPWPFLSDQDEDDSEDEDDGLNSSDAPTVAQNSGDDVFADISFTDSPEVEDEADAANKIAEEGKDQAGSEEPEKKDAGDSSKDQA